MVTELAFRFVYIFNNVSRIIRNIIDKEVWRDIEGYPDYKISSHGRVKSYKGPKVKILKLISDRGYLKITLRVDKKTFKTGVHRLVAKAFIPNPDKENYDQVDHKNHLRDDNHYRNLRWSNYEQNHKNRRDRMFRSNMSK